MHWKIPSLALCLATFLSACGDSTAPRVYTVPKEDESHAASPALPMGGAASGGSMADQTLPPEMLNQNAIAPAWTVPAGWEAQAASSMRIATFAAPGEAGPADVAITTFPGDVGGLLANVNRWRGQLGLPPTTEGEIARSREDLETLSGTAVVLEFANADTATLVSTLRHDNASWFVKMTGPVGTVRAQAENFRLFVRSTDFAATHAH